MEKWCAFNKLKVNIELIDYFIGGNQELKIFFEDGKKSKWMLEFDWIWDFRYAIENAFIGRCCDIRNQKDAYSSIYVVNNSEYIKYFEKQVSGTRPVEDLMHFLIFDKIDTGLEVLAVKEPVLHEIV